jgi:hypothetical protein
MQFHEMLIRLIEMHRWMSKYPMWDKEAAAVKAAIDLIDGLGQLVGK